MGYCTTFVAKTKALISFAVTAKLICVFVFAYAKRRFSHYAAHFPCYFFYQVQCCHTNQKKSPIFCSPSNTRTPVGVRPNEYSIPSRPCKTMSNELNTKPCINLHHNFFITLLLGSKLLFRVSYPIRVITRVKCS